jgi:hypothetical protein
MPTALHIIRANEFVCLDAEEHVDLEESKKLLLDLVRACHKRGLDHAMLDVRRLPIADKPYLTPEEMAELVGAFSEAGFTKKQRLAILYEKDPHGGVRNFTFFSRMYKMQVQAFQDFESAAYWLSEEEESCDSQPGVPIPVTKRETKRR